MVLNKENNGSWIEYANPQITDEERTILSNPSLPNAQAVLLDVQARSRKAVSEELVAEGERYYKLLTDSITGKFNLIAFTVSIASNKDVDCVLNYRDATDTHRQLRLRIWTQS